MWRRPLSAALAILVLALAPAGAAAFIDIAPPTNTVTVNWSGGDITRTVGFCVISVTGNQQSGTTVTPYDITITSSTGALTLAGPGTALPVTASWTDLVPSTPTVYTRIPSSLSWSASASSSPSWSSPSVSSRIARPDARRFYESLGFTASHEGMKLAL